MTIREIKVGDRKHNMLNELYNLLCSLSLDITHIYSDNNFAYHDIIHSSIFKTGKDNTHQIERKHLSFRTRLRRLARKPISFYAQNYA